MSASAGPSLAAESPRRCETCPAVLGPTNESSQCRECRLVAANSRPSGERWRKIPGWPDFEVSDWGRVRKIVPQHPDSDGYPQVTLRSKGRPAARIRVHRLVLAAFKGECPPGHEGLHGDDVKHNNDLTNLRWGTRRENLADRRRIVSERLAELNEDA